MLDKDNKDYKRFRKEAIEHIKCHNADALIVYYNPEDKPLMNEYVYLLEDDIKNDFVPDFINELSCLYIYPNETDTFIRTLKKGVK